MRPGVFAGIDLNDYQPDRPIIGFQCGSTRTRRERGLLWGADGNGLQRADD